MKEEGRVAQVWRKAMRAAGGPGLNNEQMRVPQVSLSRPGNHKCPHLR